MKKMFLTVENDGKMFLIPEIDACIEAYGKDCHSKIFGLPSPINFTNRLSEADRKAGKTDITDDPSRILEYFNNVAVKLVKGEQTYSAGTTDTILKKYLPNVLEAAAASVCQYLATVAVDKDSNPLTVEALDANLSAYLESLPEGNDRAKAITEMYADAVALSEDATNEAAFLRLQDIYKFDLNGAQEAAPEAEVEAPEAEAAPEAETTESTPEAEGDAVPVSTEEAPAPEAEEETSTAVVAHQEVVNSMARTGLLLRHLAQMANILADEAEANALKLADTTGATIPAFQPVASGLPEVVTAE